MAKPKGEESSSLLDLMSRDEKHAPDSAKGNQLSKGEKKESRINALQSESVQKTTRAERQELFLPISGFVWFYPEEIQVLNHPSFQRLGRINQLGQVYLVYRGGTHKRLEHSLGVLHVVQRMIDAIRHTSEKSLLRNDPSGAPIQESEERFIRLGALLHDIGHIATGHTVEDELCLIDRHDSDHRLDVLLNDTERIWEDASKRTLGELIDSEFLKYIPKDLIDLGISASVIVRLLIRKPPENEKADKFKNQQQILGKSDSIRINICRDIIGNTICADLLDYIYRDWYHIGKPRTFDERILQYMEIRSNHRVLNGQRRVPEATDQFVINLGRRPRIRTDAVSAILELLEWRYELAESVLFHRTKLAAAAMLDRALHELWGDDPENVEKILLPLSYQQVLAECKKIAEQKGDLKGKIAAEILSALEKRQLFTSLVTYSYEELPGDVQANIQQKYVESSEGLGLGPANRTNVLRVLESDFALPPGSLAMYCPTAEMGAKIAEVKIAVADEVDQFCDYEKRRGNQLSGGHLEAQLIRFQRLWKVYFFIRRDVKKQIADYLGHLRDAILKLALGHLGFEEKNEEVVHRLAMSLTTIPTSPWHGEKVLDEAISGAYREVDTAFGNYPFGAKAIRSYIEPPNVSEA